MLAVISGGSQGLGLAMARIYAARGWSVVLVARTESKLRTAVQACNSPRTSYIAADVGNPSECTRVFEEIGGVPSVVLCCAGAAQPGMFLEMNTDDLAQNLRTVYDTALYFSHAALKVMANARDKHEVRRHLVYCSSTVAVFPFIGYSAYAPAKAAIRSLSDIVRQECLEHNIRVTHVLPGTMDTEGYAVEERTKPAITRQIEGSSAARQPGKVAMHILQDMDAGDDTIFTDTISWVLGCQMLGASPRAGYGILQAIVAVFLALFGPIVRWSIDREIKMAVDRKRS